MEDLHRCEWAGEDPLLTAYHDNEWGRPVHDDGRLFEMLILEGMQAGLSWITVLRKREAFRAAFDGFSPEAVAGYGEAKIEELMENRGIIRNRRKIVAAIENAKSFLQIQQEYGSFDAFLWRYVEDRPEIHHFTCMKELPAVSPLSERLSRDLRRRGFRFVGPTILYSFMQAVGMVDDHTVCCPCHTENRRREETPPLGGV